MSILRQAHLALELFSAALFLVTHVPPVYLREVFSNTGSGITNPRERLKVGMYSATGLPIIVAVTGVAIESKLMQQHTASIFVAGGALTVAISAFLANLIGSSRKLNTTQDIETNWSSPRRVRNTFSLAWPPIRDHNYRITSVLDPLRHICFRSVAKKHKVTQSQRPIIVRESPVKEGKSAILPVGSLQHQGHYSNRIAA